MSDKQALTEWFAADVKPVRVGYYDVKNVIHLGEHFRAWWDGAGWKAHACSWVLGFLWRNNRANGAASRRSQNDQRRV